MSFRGSLIIGTGLLVNICAGKQRRKPDDTEAAAEKPVSTPGSWLQHTPQPASCFFAPDKQSDPDFYSFQADLWRLNSNRKVLFEEACLKNFLRIVFECKHLQRCAPWLLGQYYLDAMLFGAICGFWVVFEWFPFKTDITPFLGISLHFLKRTLALTCLLFSCPIFFGTSFFRHVFPETCFGPSVSAYYVLSAYSISHPIGT